MIEHMFEAGRVADLTTAAWLSGRFGLAAGAANHQVGVFPACHRPHAWCDAHNVRNWADGGETALGNLLLLCRPPGPRRLGGGRSIAPP